MDDLVPLLAIAGAILLSAMSPGPSFIIVAQTAISQTRSHGVLAALGMGVGGAIFVAATLLGLQAMLAAVPSLYTLMRIAGAAYLL